MATPNNNPAPTTDYKTAYKEVGNQFTLPFQQIKTQQQQNQQSFNTALNQYNQDHSTNLSSLSQAKVNAFKTIGLNANARGMLFSGYQPYEQNDYTQNTYNPALQKENTGYTRNVQNAKTTYSNNKLSLNQKIAQLNQDRANAANSLVIDTRNAQIAAANKAAKAAASASTRASNLANAAQYVQGSKGQYMFVGANGKPINLQQYISKTGGDGNTVLNLLKSGTNYDKNIYNKLVAAKPKTSVQLFNLLRQYDKAKAYGY